MDAATDAVKAPAAAEAPARLAAWIREGLVGHEHLVERLMIALLAGGHVLIEGPPGLAKTRAVRRLAEGLDLGAEAGEAGGFARVQCTPDLMPSDLIGAQVFRRASEEFDFVQGPLFHSLLLVDEINRAPPKTQSALLEAMAESQVTAGGVTRRLPDPFMVAATQNSIEHEGTFPLPEAQLDRFLLHVKLGLPGAEAERAILDLVETETRADQPAPPPLRLTAGEIRAARAAAARVHLAPPLKDYIVRLTMGARETEGGPLEGLIAHAVSPRGTLALAAAARARALLHGRAHALPEDVEALAPDALAHRLIPSWRASAEGVDSREIVARLLAHVRPY
ncbi:MoxR family ATPase [Neomegalonema sp.]|uniref:AAA family ATPase n=1 Tax=Neomegalonema sp. TaxID=2039713 RepID=UPI002621D27A|nr:AAA family ATPase [Neomegalonema sp.]MDD2867314.1 AAA family ATPase [Neomegalonema sp.]